MSADFNPYLSENQDESTGIGWDGKVVTITGARFESRPGKGEWASSIFNNLVVTGIAEGKEKEDTKEYSTGKLLQATPDGESLRHVEGKEVKLHKNSGAGKFFAGLQASGFPMTELVPNISKLAGARIIFRSEPQMKDGKVKTHEWQGKTYTDYDFFPAKFVGRINGAVSTALDTPVAAKAAQKVEEALKAAGGSMTRAALVPALAKLLTGDNDSSTVIQLVMRDDFHRGRSWKIDGANLSI